MTRLRRAVSWVDGHLNTAISRDLLAWGTASVALFAGVLSSEDWTIITTGFIGVRGTVEAVDRYRRGGE